MKSKLNCIFALTLSILVGVFLVACSSSPRPQPTALTDLSSLAPRLDWQTQLGAKVMPQPLRVQQNRVALATSDGQVVVIDSVSGKVLWRYNSGAPLSSGVGFDGVRAAVVSSNNLLQVLQSGKLVWQVQLPAQTFTPPLLAGGRVFVLMANREVLALDGQTGGLIWQFREDAEPLVLDQAGVLTHAHGRLLVGLGARLHVLNPDNGQLTSITTLAVPRGINDVERLIDLISPIAQTTRHLCAVAYQTQVACLNADNAQLVWSRSTTATVGVSGDDTHLANVQENGSLRVWGVAKGDLIWDSERLKFRELTAPLLMPSRILVAEKVGRLYVFDRQQGTLLGQFDTRQGQLVAPATLADQGVLLLHANGTLMRLSGF